MAVRIGELLLKEKRITAEQLQEALNYQRQNGGKLGLNLIKLGFVKDDEVTALLSRQYGVPSIALAEFEIDPAKFHEAFAADLSEEEAAVMAATQRPVAEAGFSDPSGRAAWKDKPSWAVVAKGDKAAGADVTRSMAERAGANITEVDGSHVIMVSKPQAVADVILKAVAAAG